MKKITVILLGILLTLLSAACTDSKPAMNDLTDWQSYTIIRPDNCDQTVTQAAVRLKNALTDNTGVSFTLASDWVNRGESVPVGTKEILVGVTNRPESDRDCAYLDYEIGYENGRVYITGGCSAAVEEAVNWFIANCVGQTVCVPAEPYTVCAEYPLSGVTLNGVPLTDFALSGTLNHSEQIEALRVWLAEQTGVLPAKSGEHQISVISDDTLGMLELAAVYSSGRLTLATSENGLPLEEAIAYFRSCIEAGGNAVTINERKELEMEQIKTCMQEQIEKWRAMTNERIDKILSYPNMDIPADAVVYYVSPDGDDTADGRTPDTAWKTIARLNEAELKAGNYVCFERDGMWRGQLEARTGVTYTAYGEGDKPILTRSPENGADTEKWIATDSENIWKYYADFEVDVGNLIFDGGDAHGIKYIRAQIDGVLTNRTLDKPFTDYHDLEADLHFWQDGKTLYLYSERNPGERFDSIEFALAKHCILAKGDNVTIDNLCVRYAGAHGVHTDNVKNLLVQNCEFGWIGGAIQKTNEYENGDWSEVRFGNAVELGACDGYTVKGNYIYQCYDAGITHQFSVKSADAAPRYSKNVSYIENVLEYCNYSIEYFIGSCPEENASRTENFVIADNDMWYSGYGLCEQRPDKGGSAHIKSWTSDNRNRAYNYTVENNLFVESKDMIIEIHSTLMNPEGTDSLPILKNNRFVGTLGQSFGVFAMSNPARRTYTPDILDYIGGKSNSDILYFLEK